ncbi:hypothetical protein BYT27DRAFT_7248019 [Phlegmacium glaucopus]|nr:hypothetical protein BYT27DRAFT_7248019 [Phlegmacium glaucopus]
MSRRVRFASTNVIYAPSSAGSSPSLSEASLPSVSPDLLTPPPKEVELEPSIYCPSKFPGHLELDPVEYSSKDINIHYLLAFTPYTDPVISYDLSEQPHLISTLDGCSQPATSPPLQRLTIVHPSFMWNVEVLPSSSVPGACVTVNDVLSTLFHELTPGVDPAHYTDLPPEERQYVDNAYFYRCAHIRDVNERKHAKARGVIKLDFLIGQTRFKGLSGTTSGPDIWELNVSYT